MSERDELKPCPFCGGEPGMVQQTKVTWAVMCHVCGAEGGWSNPSDAIALWNRRPTPPQAVPALTDEMIDAARPLFLALESGETSIKGVRMAISRGHAARIEYLPEWFRNGDGHLTKAGRAIIAWHMMARAAAPQPSPEPKEPR